MNHHLTQLMALAQATIDQVAEMGRRNYQANEKCVTADSAERTILEQSIRFGHALFELFLAESGTGDVGAMTYSGNVSHRRNKQISKKNYQSIFGIHTYQHWKYYPCTEQGSYFSQFEARLNIQQRRSSYLVQELLSSLAVNVPMEESASIFKQFFSQSVSKRSVDNIVVEQASHVAAYEQQRTPEPVEPDGELLVASFDGKGVSMLKGSRLCTEGTKRMSMIGVDYSVNRHIRNPSEVASNLVGSQFPETILQEKKEEAEAKVVPHARNKHYQASIKDKESVFARIRQSVDQRRTADQEIVTIVDGAPELRNQLSKYFPDATVEILDVVHAVGYIGKSVKALYKTTDYRKQLQEQVHNLLCNGEKGARGIVRKLREDLKATSEITDVDKKQVNAAITYLENNYERMKYDEYLKAGYPIATGVVESACGMLVCDRMDFAGARWHLTGAEAVLKMRAIKKSSEWDAYQKFRKEKEYDRLYAKAG